MNTIIKLIAFLGNPGTQYRYNRHNAGWLFCDACISFADLSWKRGFKGMWASFETPAGKVFCIKPDTYMNLSGESVHELSQYYRIERTEILVVHDELELPFGYISLKYSGGLGGHNGLRSINQHFKSPDFWRLRIGIGRPEHTDIAGYVLSNFSREDLQALNATIFPAAEKLVAPVIQGERLILDKTNSNVKVI